MALLPGSFTAGFDPTRGQMMGNFEKRMATSSALSNILGAGFNGWSPVPFSI